MEADSSRGVLEGSMAASPPLLLFSTLLETASSGRLGREEGFAQNYRQPFLRFQPAAFSELRLRVAPFPQLPSATLTASLSGPAVAIRIGHWRLRFARISELLLADIRYRPHP